MQVLVHRRHDPCQTRTACTRHMEARAWWGFGPLELNLQTNLLPTQTTYHLNLLKHFGRLILFPHLSCQKAKKRLQHASKLIQWAAYDCYFWQCHHVHYPVSHTLSRDLDEIDDEDGPSREFFKFSACTWNRSSSLVRAVHEFETAGSGYLAGLARC